MIKKLIEFRNKIKSKKPKFTRHDAHKKKRVGEGWRKPKGRQNKMRLGMKGYARARSTGFSSPEAVRGLSREGFTQNVVKNISDFKDLDNKTDGIIISRTVGMKKKLELVKFAEENSFVLLNIKADDFKKSSEAKLKAKKENKNRVRARRKSKLEKSKKEKKKETQTSKSSSESAENKDEAKVDAQSSEPQKAVKRDEK